MIAVPCKQHSEEWFAARLGCVTGSSFDDVVTAQGRPVKGAARHRYL